MQTPVIQSSLVESATIVAIISTVVTVTITGLIAAGRYLFDLQLITRPDLEERIAEAQKGTDERDEKIMHTLEEHTRKLDNIETLIMGSEYQVSDGMLEIVERSEEELEDHDSRIEGVERIQLKIRRRQKEHSGGEPVAREEDVDPPPDFKNDESDN